MVSIIVGGMTSSDGATLVSEKSSVFLSGVVASGKVAGAIPKALGVASCASEGRGVSPWDCSLDRAGLCACEDTVSAGWGELEPLGSLGVLPLGLGL